MTMRLLQSTVTDPSVEACYRSQLIARELPLKGPIAINIARRKFIAALNWPRRLRGRASCAHSSRPVEYRRIAYLRRIEPSDA